MTGMAAKANSARQESKSNASTDKKRQNADHASGLITPASPPHPLYGGYVDVQHVSGFDPNDPHMYGAYIYPVSPQFSVQYYPDFSNGYQSYPGSPAIHPQSPSLNPTSPPFSPTLQLQQGGLTLSPPTHAYVLPAHTGQQFPPLRLSSPILTGTSPPHQQYIQPFNIDGGPKHQQAHHKHHPQHQHQHIAHENPLQHHPLNIYVRGLSPSITDESFLELCTVYGKISSSKAIIDQKTGECKGFGFAMYENELDSIGAIEGLNKAGLQASFARVGQESFSSKLRSLQDETSTNIYISNLPLEMTEQKLEELFRPFETVSNRILRDPHSGLSRGVGFARMVDRESASAIIEQYNGFTIDGSSVPLQVRFADSPAQKKLKNQTSRKRVVRSPRDFQSLAAFPMRPMLPITPETMLGIAPMSMTSHPGYQPEYQQHAQYAYITRPPASTDGWRRQPNDSSLPVSPPDDSVDDLSTAVDNLNLSADCDLPKDFQ